MKGFYLGAALGVACGTVLTAGATIALSSYRDRMDAQMVNDAMEFRVPDFPLEADPVAAWRLTATGGAEASLSDFAGQVLFVNLWATWCAPCVKEMPHIEDLASSFDADDVAFLIVSDEDPDTVAPFVLDQGWQLPVYTVETIPPLFQSDVIPATYVLDETGEVVFKHIGGARWDDQSAIDFIANLL